MRTRPSCIALAMALSVTACASGPRAQSEPTAAVRTSSSTGPLTAQELEEATEGNMFDMIRSRRPTWLQRGRPASITGQQGTYPLLVYIDGTRLGEIETLRSINPRNLRSARFYSATDAQVRFGAGHLNGAIELISRR